MLKCKVNLLHVPVHVYLQEFSISSNLFIIENMVLQRNYIIIRLNDSCLKVDENRLLYFWLTGPFWQSLVWRETIPGWEHRRSTAQGEWPGQQHHRGQWQHLPQEKQKEGKGSQKVIRAQSDLREQPSVPLSCVELYRRHSADLLQMYPGGHLTFAKELCPYKWLVLQCDTIAVYRLWIFIREYNLHLFLWYSF